MILKTQNIVSALFICQLFLGLPAVKAETAPQVMSSTSELLKTLQKTDTVQALAQLSPEQLNWAQLPIEIGTLTERVTPLMWAADQGREDLVRALLAQGARPEIMTEQGTTATFLAAQKGHLGIVKTLFGAGADLKFIDNNGFGLMHAAATSGKVPLIDWLLQQGLPASDPDRSTVTPLFCAAETGQFAAVKRLWELTPDKHHDQEGLTALMAAAKAGNREMLTWLQAQGVLLNLRDDDGENVLNQAAAAGQFDTLKFLAEQGLDLKHRNVDHETVLMSAVASSNLELVKWLVEEQGADVKAVSHYGWTALHGAAYADQEAVVRYLLSRGADPLAVTLQNENVLMLAAGKGRLELVKKLRQQARYNLEQRDHKGRSVLQYAVKAGQLETARYLIEAGANPWVKTHEQENLLMLAAQSGNLALAHWLQESFQFDMRATDLFGYDALYHAFDHQHVDLLSWLAEQGGDLQVVDILQGSLLEGAALNGYRDLTHKLWQTGAYDLADLSLATENALRNNHLELFDELMALGARPELMKMSLLETSLESDYLPLIQELLAQGQDTELLAKFSASSLFLKHRPLPLNALKTLWKKHPDLFKVKGNNGGTPLFSAAENNQYHLARWLVEEVGVDLKALDDSGLNALDTALSKSSLPLIKYLYDQGLRFSPDRENGRNPLMLAVARNHLPLVIYLHKTLKLPLDQRDKGGDTALSLAIAAGNQQVAAWLIAAGASATTRNNQGHNLVHQAFASNSVAMLNYVLDELNLPLEPQEQQAYWQLASSDYHEIEWVRLLLKRLAPPAGDKPAQALASVGLVAELKALLADPERAPSQEGRQQAFSTAIENQAYEAAALLYRPDLFAPGQNRVLFRALVTGQMGTAEYLIEQGIGDIIITEEYGKQSIFELLVSSGNVSMLKTLIARGVKPTEDSPSNSLLTSAVHNNQLLMAEYLIQSGLRPVNPGLEVSSRPLNTALARGHLKMSEYLLKQGADPLGTDRWGGLTPMESALGSKRPKVLETFAQLSGQQLNQTFDGSKTLMHRAAETSYPGWIVWLKEKGLAIDARDEGQQTPLMLAVKQGDSPITRTLLRLGARADAIDACQQGLIAHAIGGGITPDLIRNLLEQGAPLMGKDCDGQTPAERFKIYQPYLNLAAEDQQRILELLTP